MPGERWRLALVASMFGLGTCGLSGQPGTGGQTAAFPPGALSGDCGDETRLVSLLSILRRADLAAFNEAHAHARGLTCRLTCQPFRAGP